jgi:hypothetical protein
LSTNQRRRSDPDFEVEPWADAMVNYCMFGGPKPPMSVSTEPLNPSRTYVPPAAPRKPRIRKAAPPSPPATPAAKARKPRPKPKQPPPPPRPTIDELMEECLRQSRALEAQYA